MTLTKRYNRQAADLVVMKVTTWKNCYDAQWTGIVPESYAHPAKYSPGLIQKIYAYGLESGWFKPGDVVADCFGGIGGGGIFAAYARLRWVGVELESRFVDLATRNFDLHRATWAAHGYPEPVILQGDSRRFSEIVGECAAICTSPPFETSLNSNPSKSVSWKYHGNQTYGQSFGQIGQDQGETYWTAVRQVYAECHKALKPRGYLIVVVKSYIKNKRKVPLPQQTLKLLIKLGFEPIERIKAMLVKQSVNCGLFGEDVVTEKSRKSFFRRLAEKNGSPRIDWEEVLVLKKNT